MLTTHLPVAAIATLDWGRWWPVGAIVAADLVLLAYVACCHAIVWQRLCRATTALNAARRHFRWLAENTSDVVMQLNNNGLVQWITPSVTAWIGRPEEEIVGKPFITLVHPDDRGRVEALDHQLQWCPFVETNVRLLINDGGYRWFSIAMRPLLDPSGAVVGRIGGAHDIQREMQARDVAEGERRRLNTTLESLLDPHAFMKPVRDETGRIIDFIFDDANPAACSWTGIDRDNLTGNRLLQIYPSIAASLRLVDAEVFSQRILERRARTDELTRLLNRKEVLERIETLNKHNGRKDAVLWCDIDRFKVVNDTYGHAAGDAVLQAMADRIRECLRSTDDLGARLGGDELLVFLHGVRDLEDARGIAEQLRIHAAQPILTATGPISITISIGVTIAHTDESTDALIACADDAMYQAKKLGRKPGRGNRGGCRRGMTLTPTTHTPPLNM